MARIPTDPTKAQVWVTKGLDDIDFEFYFPQGPKGDPGGFTSGTLIGTTNLNSFKTAGLYRQDSGVPATLQSNYPVVGAAGILMVTEMAGTNYVMQEWHPLFGDSRGGRVFYRREFTTPNWSPWRPFTSPRIDQSAGRALYLWDDTNSREQLIYGDTGVRDITNTLINGWKASICQIHRKNGMVVLSHYMLDPTTKTSNKFYNLPLGFRPASVYGNIMWPIIFAGGASGTLIFNASDDTLLSDGGNITDGSAIQQITWMTNDPWPSTLPGSSNGGIPNT